MSINKFMSSTRSASNLPPVNPVEGNEIERNIGETDQSDPESLLETEGEEGDDGIGEGEGETEGEEAETAQPQGFDGEAFAERAKAYAGKESRELSEALQGMITAKEQQVGGTFKVMFALMNTYGDELDNWPEPGSDTGNNPDHFRLPIVKNGVTVTRRVTFYTILAESTKEGAECVMKEEWCKRLADEKAVKDEIDRYHLDLDPRQLVTHASRYRGRIGTIRTALIQSVKLYRQLRAVNEMKGLRAEPMWVPGKSPEEVGENGMPEVENTTKPIQVWQEPPMGADGKPKPIAKWEAYSVGAFLRLNPAKADEKGGTFQALKESGVIPRANGNTPGGDQAKAINIKTLETGITALVETHRYFDVQVFGNKDQKDVGLLYKALKAKDNDELVVSVVELRNMLDQAIKDCQLEKKYVAIQQRNPDLASETNAAKPKAA